MQVLWLDHFNTKAGAGFSAGSDLGPKSKLRVHKDVDILVSYKTFEVKVSIGDPALL